VLQAAQPAVRKGKTAASANAGAWAVATWGELPNGKSWMRANGYGLQAPDGKAYHLWMQPASGNPVDVGALDVDQNGSGFTMASDLPGIDQGKSVMLTLDASGSKQPGDTIAKSDLPPLKPTMQPSPGQANQQQSSPQQENQAKSNPDSQQMHQGK
jgi:hypothetical protein